MPICSLFLLVYFLLRMFAKYSWSWFCLSRLVLSCLPGGATQIYWCTHARPKKRVKRGLFSWGTRNARSVLRGPKTQIFNKKGCFINEAERVKGVNFHTGDIVWTEHFRAPGQADMRAFMINYRSFATVSSTSHRYTIFGRTTHRLWIWNLKSAYIL